ncbi:hypothetical protein L0668_00795 [Paraglaciecola aquimarina]|uniref:PEP-CTERM protein-sorting domain-containing protein n=1 Tax=Paraglaciecola algarum TaxID=3050085 RepID=A0ABS9D1L5_9ALTE|nr:hypothetical protein [Paraglaciecola sp. G1-23]MCF2946630.1 hypothetical protein [Paraglaciecola sp. G1-23]
MFKKAFACLILVCASQVSVASFITHNGYTLDTDTNIVSDGTLEWLQWDETLGQFAASAIGSFAGWRLASSRDMISLFSDFGFDWNLSTPVIESNVINFVSLFGDTQSGARKSSAALFSADFINNGLANVFESYETGLFRKRTIDVGYVLDPINLLNFPWFNKEDFGVALVRDVEDVPVPASLSILLFGLAGVLLRSKRHAYTNPS